MKPHRGPLPHEPALPPRSTRALVRMGIALMALLLVASACGGGDDSSTADDSSEATEQSGSAEADSSTTGEPQASTETGPAGELTASARGVTPESITLGVATIDPEILADVGVDTSPIEALYQAWAGALNAEGGILGRDVEVVVRGFSPFEDTSAARVCLELTEDVESFAVIGILTDDGPLCFTEQHETPYLGLWGLTDERADRSVAPFVAIEMASDRQRAAAIEAFDSEGYFDGKQVALYSEAGDDAITQNVVEPLLDELGVDIVETVTQEDYGTDTAAADGALDIIVERLRTADPDVVLNVSAFPTLLSAFERNNWLPPQVLSTSQQAASEDVLEVFGLADETLERVVVAAPLAPTREELLDDEALLECIQTYNATDPAEPIDVEAYERTLLKDIGDNCAAFAVFVDGATAAGADLTADSWLAGVESLGEFSLPATPHGSLRPGKHSAGDAIRFLVYDPGAGAMVPSGEPVVLSGT